MGHNITILLVDDEPNIQRTLAVILERAGYLVITATSGQETIQIIEKQRVDLVFLDNNMPGMSGLELLPHILRKLPNLPVIMLTNLGQEEDSKKALALGANEYLVKANFTTEEIIEKINRQLNLQ